MVPVLTQPLPIAPESALDFSWDWSAWLAAGETIASFLVTAPAGLALFSQTQAVGVVTTWARLQGVTEGTVLSMVCTVTTTSVPARTDSRTIQLIVKQR